MAIKTFQRSTDSPASARETFEWHVRPGALRRLLAPWERARVIEGGGPTERLEKGNRQTIQLGVGPVKLRWVAEIADVQPDKLFFIDRQVSGPFKSWIHRHEIGTKGKDASKLTDSIEFALPFGPLGGLFGGGHVTRKLTRMFAWRHRTMVHDLRCHAAGRAAGFQSKTIAISGAGGLVGRSLAAFLRTGGHTVLELVRRAPKGDHEVQWSPTEGTVDHARLEGVDAIVHLAGEPVVGLRWTDEKKRKVTESRVLGTRAIVRAIGEMERPPKVLVCASAVGIYGDRGDEVLTEDSAPGAGFLSDTCAAWEDEVKAVPAGVREVRMRLGVVLDAGGGALKSMLPAFSMGVGGRLGSGRQWFPWVGLDDVVAAMHFALYHDGLAGPANLVAPGEVQNSTFTKALGSVLRRPTVLPAPKFVLRMGLGRQQADEMLLGSVRVQPTKLLSTGFLFTYPEVCGSLKHSLGREV